jgi:hypothetical protein
VGIKEKGFESKGKHPQARERDEGFFASEICNSRLHKIIRGFTGDLKKTEKTEEENDEERRRSEDEGDDDDDDETIGKNKTPAVLRVASWAPFGNLTGRVGYRLSRSLACSCLLLPCAIDARSAPALVFLCSRFLATDGAKEPIFGYFFEPVLS